MKTNYIEQAIENIKFAMTMTIRGDMNDLAYETDLWNCGIHDFMDRDTIPFDCSFDEMPWGDMTNEEESELQTNMIIWLAETLKTANEALAESKKVKKAETICLRFVKAGSVTVQAPKNWAEMDDSSKGVWANEHLESLDSEIIYDSLRDDEDRFCEAIENVENGYTADTPYTTLWKAYRNEAHEETV